MKTRLILSGLAACALFCAIATTGYAQIFVTDILSGTVGEYTTSGAPINPALISGLDFPQGIAVSGDKLFVANVGVGGIGTIAEYTTSGALLNPSLISGLLGPQAIAISGEDLFVVDGGPEGPVFDRIGRYTTSGATVNATLISGIGSPIPDIAVSGDKLFISGEGVGGIAEYTTSGALVNPNLIGGFGGFGPLGIAVSGDKLFVADSTNTIGEYTTSGVPVNRTLISILSPEFSYPIDLAVSGENLFVLNSGNTTVPVTGAIGGYTTSGATVNASLVSGLTEPIAIAVVTESVPDASSTWTLLLLGLAATLSLTPCLRRPA